MSSEDFDDPEDEPSYLKKPKPPAASVLDEFDEVQPANYLDKYLPPAPPLMDQLRARYERLMGNEKPITYKEFLERYADLTKDDKRISNNELIKQMYVHINYYFPTKHTIPEGKFRIISQEDKERWDRMRLKWNELKPLMYDARFKPEIKRLVSEIVTLMIFHKGWTRGGKKRKRKRGRNATRGRFGSSKHYHVG